MSEDWQRRILRIAEQLQLQHPPGRVELAADFDPGQRIEITAKKQGKRRLRSAVKVISDYQRRLAAQEHDAVLVVIQALDAGGKDGTIRHIFSGVNPAGVTVTSFKEPTPTEREHGYLWRYEHHLPKPGQIAVFNRSHYEEVLVVRVHPELLDAEHTPTTPRVWSERYDEINRWERELTDRGVRIVKLLLNISNEEQRVRFLRRLDLPEKHWKFSASDIRERDHWDEYQFAIAQMLSHTSTEHAPWYVIPADHKWFARLAAASILMRTLQEIDPRIPQPDAQERAQLDAARSELKAQSPPGKSTDPVAEHPDRYR
ncbi:MAG: PPK2 family polyphosphate kinase [Solirubrobacteraceae bacterium]